MGQFCGSRLLLLSIVLSQLTGCAWASRNVYHEPDSGDIGSILIINRASPYRDSVWVYDSRGTSGKAMTNFDLTPERSIKVKHSDTIVLQLDLIHARLSSGFIKISRCLIKTYEVPFSSGDLKVVFDIVDNTCSYSVFQADPSHGWKLLGDLHEWRGELRGS